MELNTEVPTQAPRDAATVVLLRDTPQGMEVFLMQRHGLSDVMGGAYVFPGGKLDPADLLPESWGAYMDQDSQRLPALLGEDALPPATAAGLYVAAARETREEASVHLPRSSQLLPWVRWITPRMPSVSNKRFDTRFFLAAMPYDQVAVHDNHETTDSVWLPARTALQRYWDGEFQFAPPQIMSLAHLARHANVASAVNEARKRPPPMVLPESFDLDGQRAICYPGDPLHSVPIRALPGPTRLVVRGKRFEPLNGFEGFFA